MSLSKPEVLLWASFPQDWAVCDHVSYHLHANLKPVDLFYHVFETSTLFQMITFLPNLVPSKTVQNKQKETNKKTTCQKSDIIGSSGSDCAKQLVPVRMHTASD